LGGQDRLQVALLLLLAAVGDHHRSAHHQAEHVRRRGGLGPNHLLTEDRLLDRRRAATAVLLGPGKPGVPGLVELALPLAAELEGRFVSLGLLARVVLLDPCAELVPEGLLAWREGQIHEGGMLLADGAVSSSWAARG